jgi:hypothetical protein
MEAQKGGMIEGKDARATAVGGLGGVGEWCNEEVGERERVLRMKLRSNPSSNLMNMEVPPSSAWTFRKENESQNPDPKPCGSRSTQ